jgi:hypothetical protein
MNLDIYAEDVDITPQSESEIKLSIIGVDSDMVLDHFDETQIVRHFPIGELLDEIGIKACMEYFDLEVKQ